VHDKNILYGYIIYARVLHNLGRGGEAAGPAQKAVELATELDLDEGLGDALIERAKARLTTDRRGARADLEQGAILLERGRAGTASTAHADFLLAIVIYPDDHKTARTHANSARSALMRMIEALPPDDPSTRRTRANKQAEVDEIDAWLRSNK